MFKLILDGDMYLGMIEPRHAGELNALVAGSYEHIREWSNWLKSKDRPIEQTAEWIVKNQLRYATGDGYEIGIWHRGAMAGQIGYNYFNKENRSTEIGYWLGESSQGNGLITRACTALIDHAFAELDINRIEIRCGTENLKSRKIPEKLGFSFEGIASGTVSTIV